MQKKQKQQTSTFLRKLRDGKVCVHPTDTIPGLTCDPWNETAVLSLEQNKKRTQKKTFVGLLSSFERAKEFWQPLPEFWLKFIPRVWPGPLTFIWKAGTNVPTCMISKTGELALRCPRLHPEADWFRKVMEQVDYPLPSTSINYEEGTPIVDAKELASFCKTHSIYLPELLPISKNNLPSSLIRIVDNEHFEWLRKGAFAEEEFSKLYTSLKNE